MNPPPVTKSHGTSSVVQAPAGPAASKSAVIRMRRCVRMALLFGSLFGCLRSRGAGGRDHDVGDAVDDHVQRVDQSTARIHLLLVENHDASGELDGLVRRAVTGTLTPLIDRPSISESPDPPAPATASASAMMKSTQMLLPATDMPRLPRDASEAAS